MPVAVVVTEVEPSKTFALRQRVLRPHQSLEQMSLFDDDSPDSASFAATDPFTDEVIGTANVRRAPLPPSLEEALPENVSALPSWRLRGMATREDLRSRGIGASVLAACLDHIARKGGGLLWCNARTRAEGFYKRGGFSVHGEEFEEGGLGPHLVMWRVVDPAGSGDGAASAVNAGVAQARRATAGGRSAPGEIR